MGFSTSAMDNCSSGEETIVKARKPYTITKQRERWTEDEHNRFLEALKLYGRAWQRIEEHIGTKTAVQIRSHAQKFFTKLEKEASTKGVPLGQTLDIDIPPPRPKRKPSNPYPRKTSLPATSSSKDGKDDISMASVYSSSLNKDAPNLKRSASFRAKESCENEDCSEVLTLFQNNPCISMGSEKKSYVNPITFREFVPMLKETKGKDVMDKTSKTVPENEELSGGSADHADLNIGRLERICIGSQTKAASMEIFNRQKQPESTGKSSKNQIQGVQNCVKHVPVHFVEETKDKDEKAVLSDPTYATSLTNQEDAQVNANPFRNASASTTSEHHTNSSMSSIHQLPNFPPINFFHSNQDAYRSLFNISSTFSNLIVSTLLQNPAAHAAASLAASFCPMLDSEKIRSATSENLNGTIPGGHVNHHPSMAAIAAATVAAATAWWATQGLYPLCHPLFPPGFSFTSATATASPTTMANQAPEEKQRDNESLIHPQQGQQFLDQESPEHLVIQCSASKPLVSSDDDSGGAERIHGVQPKSPGINELLSTPDNGLHESNSKVRSIKKQDFYSSGSHKHSGSEETETVLEKLEDCNEELGDSQINHSSVGETNGHRSRNSGNFINESWKEVSEEGRLAFQALFSREVLPQSFSPPRTEDGMMDPEKERGDTMLAVDLNSRACADTEPDHVTGSDVATVRSDDHLDKSATLSETKRSKSLTCRTGFKPYKRCSMEANVARVTAEEEKGNKRLHMEGKASNL